MASLNLANLETIIQALVSHANQAASKDVSHQAAIDQIVQVANSLDTALVAIIQAPDPGPRTDLDFTALDNAVLAFKENSKIGQTDANNVAGLIALNTPK